VYDPVIGRFLSADPLTSRLDDSQELNPYSYTANRPLSRIDPSGHDDCGGCESITINGGPPDFSLGGGIDPFFYGSGAGQPGSPFNGSPSRSGFPPGHAPTVPSGIQVGPVQTFGQVAKGQDSPLQDIIRSAMDFDPTTYDMPPDDADIEKIVVTGQRDTSEPIEQIIVIGKKPEGVSASDVNILIGAGAAIGEPASGRTAMGTNWRWYKQPRGNQHFHTAFKLSEVFNKLGKASLVAGTYFDFKAVDAGKKSEVQADFNLGLGLSALAFAPLAVPGTVYAVVSNFYPAPEGMDSQAAYNAALVQSVADSEGQF
jgi:hypothetical protein